MSQLGGRRARDGSLRARAEGGVDGEAKSVGSGKMKHQLESEIDGDGTTEQLARWIVELRAESMPARVLERAKHLILDGIGCGLVGARVPWSAKMLDAVSAYEPDGPCSVIGSEKVRSAPDAARKSPGGALKPPPQLHSALPQTLLC